MEDGIRQIWAATDVGTADVKVDRLTKGTESRWMDYMHIQAVQATQALLTTATRKSQHIYSKTQYSKKDTGNSIGNNTGERVI